MSSLKNTGLEIVGNWKDFTDYKGEVDRVIGQYRMIAVCTYSLERRDGL